MQTYTHDNYTELLNSQFPNSQTESMGDYGEPEAFSNTMKRIGF